MNASKWKLFALLMIFVGGVFSAKSQLPLTTLQFPVNGVYARHFNTAPDTVIGAFDASSNSWSPLLSSRNDRMFWRGDGAQVVLRQHGSAFTILNYPELTISSNILNLTGLSAQLPSDEISYKPLGWSADGSNLLIQVSYRLPNQPRHYEVYLTDLAGTILHQVRQWNGDEIVTTLPLPPNVSTVQLTGTTTIERNPVFDNWVLVTGAMMERNCSLMRLARTCWTRTL